MTHPQGDIRTGPMSRAVRVTGRAIVRRIPRRAAMRFAVAAGLSLCLAVPALAQESPTPPPTSEPSPVPSAPAPSPAPDREPTVHPDRQDAPQKPRKKPSRHRKQRRERRRDREARRRTQLKPACAPFSHTQTYLTWGPALAYGDPVTVVYSAKRCTKPHGSMVEVTTQGSATVYQGVLVEGEPIDRRPFRLTGAWDRPSNEAGWPLAWWGCGVKHALYRWEIPGVYTFDVGARWGVWTLTVATQPVGPLTEARTVHWSYNGCG